MGEETEERQNTPIFWKHLSAFSSKGRIFRDKFRKQSNSTVFLLPPFEMINPPSENNSTEFWILLDAPPTFFPFVFTATRNGITQ